MSEQPEDINETYVPPEMGEPFTPPPPPVDLSGTVVQEDGTVVSTMTPESPHPTAPDDDGRG